MLTSFKFSKSAVAVAIICAGLVGCGGYEGSGATVSQPDPVSTFAAVEGHWNKTGYGEFISIANDTVDLYEFNQVGCIKTASFSYEQSEMLVEDVHVTADDEMSLQLQGQLSGEYYQANDTLPDSCITPIEVDLETSPVQSFEYFWHSFNDYYGFFAERGVNWQQMYDLYQPQVSEETTDEQLLAIFAEMLTPLADAHVSVDTPTDGFNVAKPVPLYQAIEAMVQASVVEGAPQDLEQVQGEIVQLYQAMQSSYITTQTLKQYPLDDDFPTLLWGKTEHNAGVLVINSMYDFVDMEDDSEEVSEAELIVAVNEKMTEVMADLADTQGLIVDIRNNGGGADSVALAIAQFFAQQDAVVFNKQALNLAGQGHVYQAQLSANENAYTAPVYVVTSQATVSAAEIFTMAMKTQPQVTLVGEPTSGALSDLLTLILPNGWSISLSNEVYQDEQGHGYEVTGIEPDLPVSAYTQESIRNGQFESYQLALEQLELWQSPQLSTADFETQINDLMNEGQIPGAAIAVVKGGQIVYQQGFGRADESGRAVTEHTPFFIASISKTLLGTTIAQVEAAGLLDISDKIEPALGFEIGYPGGDFDPSFQQLVTHTSGIIDESMSSLCSYYYVEDHTSVINDYFAQPWCPETIDTDLGNYLRSYLTEGGALHQEANFSSSFGAAPGEVNQYSNFGAALAGLALEGKTGKSLPELTNQYVINPLGLTNTSWSIEGIPEDVARRYRVDVENNTQVPWDEYSGVTYPDGGGISSAHDLAKYMAAVTHAGKYQGQQYLNPQAVEKMLTKQSDLPVTDRGVGYFWRLDGHYVAHNGGDLGVMADVWADTDKDVAVVLLTNGDILHGPSIESMIEMFARLKTFAYSH